MGWQTISAGLCFGDGARWHDGKLWLSDMHAGDVLSVGPDGTPELVCHVPGSPSGLGWLPDGRLLVVSMHDRAVLRLEPNGQLQRHADLRHIATFYCNDMVVSANGTAYVGNFGSDFTPGVKRQPADLAMVCPDGRVEVAWRGLGFPNGGAISPDGRVLILAETMMRRLLAFPVASTGHLGKPAIWADLGVGLPDGIALDAEGAVWFADPRAHACVRVAEGGQVLETLVTPESCYSCALGGEDGRTLFVVVSGTDDEQESRRTRTGSVLATRIAVPGAEWGERPRGSYL